MRLNKQLLPQLDPRRVELPPEGSLEYPEKILQFGTGVLLRALPDYFIDQANKKGRFRGRIVMVKSTAQGDLSALRAQDHLYTCYIRGMEQGRSRESFLINGAVSRSLDARTEWEKVREAAKNPSIRIVISNTTEVGLRYFPETISPAAPEHFPAKLLDILLVRYQALGNAPDSGLVIIPTELLPDNASVLKQIVLRLGKENQLDARFLDWVENQNHWCSSLVDRIVPGKLPAAEQQQAEAFLGYEDPMLIMAEPYRLWAIECSDPKVLEILSFGGVEPGMVISPDIRIFRELKLRLLNGSHTLCCGLAFLAGISTVREAMADSVFRNFMEQLMKEEIIPAIVDSALTEPRARTFADDVLDRFSNPFLQHPWLNITLQYSSKIRMRDLPLLKAYLQRRGSLPHRMVLGWAAFLKFMQGTLLEDGKYYGQANGSPYLIQDDQAPLLAQAWKDPGSLVPSALSDTRLWGEDLTLIPGLEAAVTESLQKLETLGARAAINALSTRQTQMH